MTPRRLLNSTQVGEKLGGLSNRAITQRLSRPYPSIPEPDFVIEVPGRGEVHGWLPDRDDLVPPKPATDDPALLGDPASLPDCFLIGPKQWAHLTGWWGPQYVIQQRSEALRRRALGTSLAGDIPHEDEMRGNSPRWAMGTYRAWRKAVQEARGEGISEEER
jgi:hypothetical protein